MFIPHNPCASVRIPVYARNAVATCRPEWIEPIGEVYRGHVLHEVPPSDQGIAALMAVEGCLAASDPRRDGLAAGF